MTPVFKTLNFVAALKVKICKFCKKFAKCDQNARKLFRFFIRTSGVFQVTFIKVRNTAHAN